MVVLDTNVVSELMRPLPSARVEEWLESQPLGTRYTTAVTIAEVLFGVRRLPAGRRRDQLAQTAERNFASFSGQVLAFDEVAADECGALQAARQRAGDPIGAFDAQIAAICLVQDATLATRNVRHFEGLELEVVDPWAYE